MLKNYLKIVLRNIIKYKSTSLTYFLSLVIGFVGASIIFLIVNNELSFDDFHENSENIYRVVYAENDKVVRNPREIAAAGPPAGPQLVENLPEIESFLRIRYTDNSLISNETETYNENKVVYADSNFFNFYSFNLLIGNSNRVLSEPGNVVLSESIAKKYFGNDNPLDKILYLDNETRLVVKGVYEDFPVNSHIDIDFIISFETFSVPEGYPVTLQTWAWASFPTYLELNESADVESVQNKCTEILASNMPEGARDRFIAILQPLEDVYLGKYEHDQQRKGQWSKIYGLGLIGILLLGIAAFNFINLITARSLERAKEIGVRKVVGASKHELRKQILGESVIITLLSALISTLVLYLFVKTGITIAGISLSLIFNDLLFYAIFILTAAIVIGLLSGLYPSIMFASIDPARILKKESTYGNPKSPVRKLLISFQFAISIFLITVTLIISNQMQFITDKNLGFDEENVVILKVPRSLSTADLETLETNIANSSFVKSVGSSATLLDGNSGSVPVFADGITDEIGIPMNIFGVSYNFFETLGIQLKDGRTISKNFSSDTSEAIILNQAAASLLGFEKPVGNNLRVSDLVDGKIIGVTDDFHFASLHRKVEPLAIFYTEYAEYVYVRLAEGNFNNMLSSLNSIWNSTLPNVPFEYRFLDENLNQLYKAENSFLDLVMIFSIVSIFVACLGLIGLVSFSIIRRKREIGIRKVLGASVVNIFMLVSKEFLLLIIYANVFAWPLAYYFGKNWLQDFAYQTNIDFVPFILASLAALLFSFISISFKAAQAASTNPVKTIRYE